MIRPGVLIAALVFAAVVARADLAEVRAEPNLEKRSRRALEHAEKMLGAARQTYKTGDWDKTLATLQEVGEAVDLAYTSLKATGKSPRKSYKYFKNAELKTRELQRKLEDFMQSMSVDEREKVEPIRALIQKIHDEILGGVMGTEDWTTK